MNAKKNDYGTVLFGIIVKYLEDMIILNIIGFLCQYFGNYFKIIHIIYRISIEYSTFENLV